jgi:hypothetical protein
MERFAILRAVRGIDGPARRLHSAAGRHCRFAHLSATQATFMWLSATAVRLLDPTDGGLRADGDVVETKVAI